MRSTGHPQQVLAFSDAAILIHFCHSRMFSGEKVSKRFILFIFLYLFGRKTQLLLDFGVMISKWLTVCHVYFYET